MQGTGLPADSRELLGEKREYGMQQMISAVRGQEVKGGGLQFSTQYCLSEDYSCRIGFAEVLVLCSQST